MRWDRPHVWRLMEGDSTVSDSRGVLTGGQVERCERCREASLPPGPVAVGSPGGSFPPHRPGERPEWLVLVGGEWLPCPETCADTALLAVHRS